MALDKPLNLRLLRLEHFFGISSFLGLILSGVALYKEAPFILYAIVYAIAGAFGVLWFYLREIRRNRLALENCISTLHRLTHDMRDSMLKLENDFNAGRLTFNVIQSELNSVSTKTVNRLSKSLSEIVGEKVCVHIKHIPFSEEGGTNGTDLMKASFQTICNCDSTQNQSGRNMVGVNKISENTHYKEAVLGKALYIPDLENHIKEYNRRHDVVTGGHEKEYKIGNNFWQDYYKSMVLVPIQSRVASNEHPDVDVLGLLMADSQTVNAFRNDTELKNIVLGFVKAHADAMFYFLWLIRNYQQKLQ